MSTTTTIIIKRSKLMRARLVTGPGPAWKWTYECQGPTYMTAFGEQSGRFTNDSIVELRRILKRRYGRDVVIVEPWKAGAQ
jgi:hypothetical protein